MEKLFDRFSRQIKLAELGEEGQHKLSHAKVLIVGVGGLGCPAAQYLVASGVGKIGLMDADKVDISNLHRQILFSENDIGKWKVEVAREVLKKQNSDVEFECYKENLHLNNALEIISEYDLVIDGTDNFQAKYLINDSCILANKPWVYSSIYKFEGQVSVFNYQGGPSYRCLFPKMSSKDISCEETGVLGTLPGVLGVMQASEALKMILGIGKVLSGKLKIMDLLLMNDQTIRIPRNEDEFQKVLNRDLSMEEIYCTLKKPKAFYLDVREPDESPQVREAKVINIPLLELSNRVNEIPRDKKVHVFCQSGIRSEKALRFLQENFGFKNLINVPGGIQTLLV